MLGNRFIITNNNALLAFFSSFDNFKVWSTQFFYSWATPKTFCMLFVLFFHFNFISSFQIKWWVIIVWLSWWSWLSSICCSIQSFALLKQHFSSGSFVYWIRDFLQSIKWQLLWSQDVTEFSFQRESQGER